MQAWTSFKLEEVVETAIDYRGKTPPKTAQGIPLITAKLVKNGRIQEPDEFIPELIYDEWMTRGLPEINDVILTTEAPLGEVALLKIKKVALAQRIIVLRGKNGVCDNVFLKYYLQSPMGQEELIARASGTTVEGIKAAELKKISIFLPSFPEQRAIASVLSNLDGKIDLLYSQNKTLESMAEALFRKWFVEGENVDWEDGKLGDIAHNPRRTIGPDRIKPGTPYIGLEHMPQHSIALCEWETSYELQSNKFEFMEGEILFGKLRPYFHKVGVAPLHGICSTDILVISPRNQAWYGLVLGIVSSTEFVNAMDSGSEGTRMPRTCWNHMASYDIKIPPERLAAQFTNEVKPLLSKIRNNIMSIHTLARVRDALLPKLMAGDIRVR